MSYVRSRGKSLGLVELIAIAIGGMVGGGIFSILGISVSLIGNLTPIAIAIGGLIASLAAYSYVKLGVYYKDEGATYSFVKRTYPDSPIMASAVGWIIIFGYISTLALYAYTFASYAISSSGYADDIWIRKILAIGVIAIFMLINLWSVKGMGKIEDLMVYTKLIILFVISILLMEHGSTDFSTFLDQMIADAENTRLIHILIVSAVTFVAYEGFQLVINAVNEMKNPDKNIPRAIYGAIFVVVIIYLVIAFGALFALPKEEIIKNKEYALAAGASEVLGKIGEWLVIFGALLATSSAISGTVFGSSRQMAVVADDGFFPKWLAFRKNNIPTNAIIAMSVLASFLIIIGGLRLILEFGSITFLLVSLFIAITNYKIKDKTRSSSFLTILSILGLSVGAVLILYFEWKTKLKQLEFILFLYFVLAIGAWLYGKKKLKKE